jgi:HK97 family phage prohead protease
MDHIEVAVKQVEAEGEGRFRALVAVFDNIDRVNDRMRKGAFRESLRKWRDADRRIPVIWSHKADSPDSVIGSASPFDVSETSDGLVVEGQLDVGESSLARRAWQLLKSGAVSGWSFGYLTKREKRDKRGINELLEVELLEIGPTVTPANLATATLGVKGLGTSSIPASTKSAPITIYTFEF